MNNEEDAASRTITNHPPQQPTLDQAAPNGGDVTVLSKRERVALIYAELAAAPAVESREMALELFDQVFRKIEDAHSGVLHDPQCTIRLCPPVAEQEQTVDGKPWLRRYRHTDHYTLIAENGAIEILIKVRSEAKAVIGVRTVFEKQGADGFRVSELK